MGGRGDTSKSFNENKVVSNIDAPRNKPFREKRAKELEAERVAKLSPIGKRNRPVSKIIDKPGTVSAVVNTGKTKPGTIESITERENLPSLARSKDGLLHVTKQDKNSFTVTDAVSGTAVRTFGSKKAAVQFLNAATRKDGTVSPTIARAVEYTNMSRDEVRSQGNAKSGSNAFRALLKVGARIRASE